MSFKDAEIRQDLIENGVQHELASIQDDSRNAHDFGPAVESELEHDLLVWPREYLEPYLDSDSSGRVPLNEVQLQDLLEAAFERDAELALNSGTEPNVAPEHSKSREQIASATGLGERPDFKKREASRATDNGLQQIADEGQASLIRAISEFKESMRWAAGPSDIVPVHRLAALTDSGVYTGRIVAETPELIIQRISSVTEVAHPKESFIEIPNVGQLLRIAYRDNIATVREIQERKIERGLSR